MGAATAEADLVVGVMALDVEGVRILEHRLIPVGRHVPHDDLFVSVDLDPAKLGGC